MCCATNNNNFQASRKKTTPNITTLHLMFHRKFSKCDTTLRTLCPTLGHFPSYIYVTNTQLPEFGTCTYWSQSSPTVSFWKNKNINPNLQSSHCAQHAYWQSKTHKKVIFESSFFYWRRTAPATAAATFQRRDNQIQHAEMMLLPVLDFKIGPVEGEIWNNHWMNRHSNWRILLFRSTSHSSRYSRSDIPTTR